MRKWRASLRRARTHSSRVHICSTIALLLHANTLNVIQKCTCSRILVHVHAHVNNVRPTGNSLWAASEKLRNCAGVYVNNNQFLPQFLRHRRAHGMARFLPWQKLSEWNRCQYVVVLLSLHKHSRRLHTTVTTLLGSRNSSLLAPQQCQYHIAMFQRITHTHGGMSYRN